MRKKMLLIYIIGISSLILGCSKTVDINKYIDRKQNLVLFNISDSLIIIDGSNHIITPYDIRYLSLLDWGKANVNDWECSTLSYEKRYGVFQNNFSLSVNDKLVIVNLNSENKQYIKKIENKELLFLLQQDSLTPF